MLLLLYKLKIEENIFKQTKKYNTFGDPEIMSCLIKKWKHIFFLNNFTNDTYHDTISGIPSLLTCFIYSYNLYFYFPF